MALVAQINEVAAPAEIDRAIRLAANARKADLGKRMKERFKQRAPSDASA
jgi:hypothetical protein